MEVWIAGLYVLCGVCILRLSVFDLFVFYIKRRQRLEHFIGTDVHNDVYKSFVVPLLYTKMRNWDVNAFQMDTKDPTCFCVYLSLDTKTF